MKYHRKGSLFVPVRETDTKDPWVPTRNIWVPKRSLRDCRGFISSAKIGVLARRRDTRDPSILFEWHCEDLNVSNGTPSGYSAGDGTGVATSAAEISSAQYKDGSNSLSIPTSGDYVSFDWSSSDVLVPTAGTLDFWYRHTTSVGEVFHFWIDGNNRIRISIDQSSKYVAMLHKGGGTERNCRTNTNVLNSADTWYHVKARWDQTVHGSLYMKLTCDETTGESNSADNGTDQPANMTGASGSVNFGDYLGVGGGCYLDNIVIYNSWQ